MGGRTFVYEVRTTVRSDEPIEDIDRVLRIAYEDFFLNAAVTDSRLVQTGLDDLDYLIARIDAIEGAGLQQRVSEGAELMARFRRLRSDVEMWQKEAQAAGMTLAQYVPHMDDKTTLDSLKQDMDAAYRRVLITCLNMPEDVLDKASVSLWKDR